MFNYIKNYPTLRLAIFILEDISILDNKKSHTEALCVSFVWGHAIQEFVNILVDIPVYMEGYPQSIGQ